MSDTEADDTADGENVLLLAPYTGHWEIADYPDSRVLKADCGHLAWLSPQGEPYLASCRTECLACAAVNRPKVDGMVQGTLNEAPAQVRAQFAAWAARNGLAEVAPEDLPDHSS